MTKTKRLLLIDSSNNFLRNFIINPTLSSTTGAPVGGIVGSLQSIHKFIEDMKPDKVILCWDGEGGSARRKQNDKHYKSGRVVPKLNWKSDFIGNDNDIINNKLKQMSILYEFVELLPINQIMLSSVEADDVIAYIVQMNSYLEWQKIIVSSDKDFIQLLNEKTVLFRPTQHEIINVKRALEKYEIHPNNFLLARAICGDKSDNLAGVEGAGLPTMAKRFAFLREEKQYLIPDIYEVCSKEIKNKNKIKIYQNILENKEKIEHNYSMMQLVIPKMSIQDTKEIQRILNEKKCFLKTDFIKYMNRIGFSINIESFVQFFNRLHLSSL